MKNIFTKFILITSILMGLLLSVSCQKEKLGFDSDFTVDLSKMSDREAFDVYQSKIAPLHSEGLEHIFKLIQKDHSNMHKIDLLTDQFMETTKIQKIVKEYKVGFLDESITKEAQAEAEISMLNQICFNFVDKIHQASKSPLSVEELKKETIKVLNDRQFLNLSKERKHVIMVGLSIYEDSYAYWIDNLKRWDDETQPEAAKLDFWGRLKQIAKADLAGGVGGAVGGAVVGAFAGGVGAGPGAVGGAVGGAISGSVTSALN